MNPIVGRDVHWFEGPNAVPMAAKIVAVHDDKPGTVNLVVWDSGGSMQRFPLVPQREDGATGPFWDWPAE